MLVFGAHPAPYLVGSENTWPLGQAFTALETGPLEWERRGEWAEIDAEGFGRDSRVGITIDRPVLGSLLRGSPGRGASVVAGGCRAFLGEQVAELLPELLGEPA